MSNIKPTTKEQLVHYLLMQINLGTYDRRFLTNTLNLNISPKKPVTTNQAALLNKIVERYARQLAKKELSVGDLISLPWSSTPVDSKPEFTDAYLTLDDTTLILKSPYKSAFVRAMRDLSYTIWHVDEKFWSIPAGLYTLHQIVSLLEEHYDKINYCPEITKILNEAKLYSSEACWDPTLIKKNGRLYVAAINSSLNEAIADVTLSDTLASMARLTKYGIRVDSNLVNQIHDAMGGTSEAMDQILFSLQFDPKIDIASPSKVVQYISDLKPDSVIVTDTGNSLHNSTLTKIIDTLTSIGINVQRLTRATDISTVNFDMYEYPIVLNLGSIRSMRRNSYLEHAAGKQVHLVDSTPIDLFRKK
jgi:hypothetical protein